MRKLRTLFAIMAVLWSSVYMSAYDFEENGIWYTVSPTTLDAEVSGCSDKNITSITIPYWVAYDGKYYSVRSIRNGAFSGCSSLTDITIPNGVTSIGNSAFSGCRSLTAITIPDGVTSIGYWAFRDCRNLIAITIPENSQLTSIGDAAFDGCSSLTTITIPKSVTSIGFNAFSGCSSLTAINIPKSVTSIGSSAFDGCSSLTAVHIGDIAAWCNIDFPNVVSNPLYYAKNLYFKGKLVTKLTFPEGMTSIRNYAFSGCSSLTTITIPEGVTSIGDCAFAGCSSLTTITIPEGVTSIGDAAFDWCTSLTTITIPENSQLASIGSCAFYGCSSLTAITIPESVTSIGSSAFSGCSSLTAITLPESVTSIGNSVFDGCRGELTVNCNILSVASYDEGAFYNSNFTKVTIGDKVTSIGDYAFYDCSSLKTVVNYSELDIIKGTTFYGYVGYYADRIINIDEAIDNYAFKTIDGVHYLTGYIGADTELTLPTNYGGDKYQIGESAFFGCSDLTTITIPENSRLTSIGSCAFYGCSSLTAITIPESSQLTSIGEYAFYNCSNLTAITLPEGVTRIGSSAFSGCSNLTIITIPESVTSIGYYAFYGCSSLTAIVIPEGVTSIGNYAFSDCSSLTSITLPKSVTSIGNYAFSGCSNLININIPQSVTWVGVYAFYNCSSLTAINIPEGVTSIRSYTFYGCSSLTEITIPEGSQLTSIGESAFYNCSSLTAINIHEGVTSIGSDAFRGCSSLIKINIHQSVTWVGGYAFYKCSSLTTITIPENSQLASIGSCAFYGCGSLTAINIPEGVTSIGSSVFCNCSSLTAINIPESVTSMGEWAFASCSSLTTITIPEGVTSIGDFAFRDCSSLTAINIPEGVTSIGENAFSYCSSLTSITIPESVTMIWDEAFAFCTNLVEIYCYAEKVPSASSNIFTSCNYRNITLYADANILESYKEKYPWSNFGKFKTLEVDDIKDLSNERLYHISQPHHKSGATSWAIQTAGEKLMSNKDLNIPVDSHDPRQQFAFVTYDNGNTYYLYHPAEKKFVNKEGTLGDYAVDVIHLKNGAYDGTFMAYFDESHYINVGGSSQMLIDGWMIPDGGNSCSILNLRRFDPAEIPMRTEYDGIEYRLIPKTKKAEVVEGDYAGDISIPSTVTYGDEVYDVTCIGHKAFYGCVDLTSINLPVTMESIGWRAFEGCSGLTTITLPGRLSSIGQGAFYMCNKLEEVYCYASEVPSIEESTFYKYDATLNVPSKALSKYKSTYPWSMFERIKAIDSEKVISVSLDQTAAMIVEGESIVLIATIEPDDIMEQEITWETLDSTVAIVDDSGKVTALAAGSTVITASVGSKSAECEITVKSKVIPVSAIVLSQTSATLLEGEQLKLIAAVSPENATDKIVVWSTSDASVASVDENGEISAIAAGEAIITASVDGKSASCLIIVEKGIVEVSNIELDITSVSLFVGNQFQLTATITPSDATNKDVLWGTTNSQVAVVDADGMVTILSEGTARIIATIGDKSASCWIEALSNYPPITSIEALDNWSLYHVSQPHHSKGATSWAVQTNGNEFKSNKDIGITVDKSDSRQMFAIISNDEGKSHYLYHAAEVKFVNKDGSLGDKPIDPIYFKDGAYSGSFMAYFDDKHYVNIGGSREMLIDGWKTPDGGNSCEIIRVGDFDPTEALKEFHPQNVEVESLILSQTTVTLIEGDMFTLTVGINPENATDQVVKWSTSDNSIAVVDDNGVVTAISVGSVTIIASVGGKSAECEIIVKSKVIPVSAIELSQTSITLLEGEQLKLTATVIPENATDKVVVWSTSNTSVAIVDENGEISAIAEGKATIIAKAGEITSTSVVIVIAASGVEQLIIDASQLIIYDLQGRRVLDVENIKGGLYIVNGRKVIMK